MQYTTVHQQHGDSAHLLEKGIDVAMMTVLSLALTETSVPRLPFLPFTLMLPLRKSSCRAGGEGKLD